MEKIDELDFEKIIEDLRERGYCITTLEELKDFAVKNIYDENLFVAIHILEAIQESDAEYFEYDYSMGTLETPRGIKNIEDLSSI